MTKPKNKIYNRLKLLRTSQNLSRETLAESLGINIQTVGYLEREDYNPSLILALKIAKYFNLSIEEIFSDKPFECISKTIREANYTSVTE